MKVSQRSVVPPFAVMDILAEVERRRAAGDVIHSLCAGEPEGGAPTDVRERAAALLTSGERLGYTAALGTPELRATIAAHYERSYGVRGRPVGRGRDDRLLGRLRPRIPRGAGRR